jgi:hypothetical protein
MLIGKAGLVRRLTFVLAASAIAASTAIIALGAGPASAGILPTTTTVATTPATTLTEGAPLSIVATVGPLDLIVTPTGTVTFSATGNGVTIPLGTGTLSTCIILLSTCTATDNTTIAGVPNGTYVITAAYSGDTLSDASSATTSITVTGGGGGGGGGGGTACTTGENCTPAIVIAPTSVTEMSTDGEVGFDVEGSGWYANEQITLTSPGLNTSCTTDGGIFGAGNGSFTQNAATPPPPDGPGYLTLTTDFGGVFNAGFLGDGCSSGIYQVTAQEVGTPNRTATADLTIVAPTATTTTGLVLSPSSQVEDGVGGDVATTLLIATGVPNETVSIASPTMTTACSSTGPDTGVQFFFIRGNGFENSPATGETDFANNLNVVLVGQNCVAGSYPITVSGTGNNRAMNYTEDFTVTAP